MEGVQPLVRGVGASVVLAFQFTGEHHAKEEALHGRLCRNVVGSHINTLTHTETLHHSLCRNGYQTVGVFH